MARKPGSRPRGFVTANPGKAIFPVRPPVGPYPGGGGTPLSISGTLAAGTVGAGGTFLPIITGGTAPYTLSVASGTLPPGRSISGLTVTGSYTTAGTYSYTLRATDSKGATADLAVTVTVAPPVVIRLTGTGGRSATGLATLTSTYTKLRNRSVSTILSDASVVTFVFPIGWYKRDTDFQTQRISFPAGTTVRARTDYGSATATTNSRPAYVAVGDFAQAPPLGVLTGTDASVACEGNQDYLYVTMTAAQYGVAKLALGQITAAAFEMDYVGTAGPRALTDSTIANATSTSGEGCYEGGTTSMGTAGPLAANGGVSVNKALRPIAVIADGVVIGVASDGDSITGAGKDAGRPAGDGSTALSGLMMNGLFQTGRPYAVGGKNGATCAALAALPITDRQFDIHRWSEVSGIGFATNDLAIANDSAGIDLMIANHRQLRAKIASIPTPSGAPRKIFATMAPPRLGSPASSTANNGTAITGNSATATQKVQANFANDDAALVALHNMLAADLAAGNMNLHAVVNLRTALGDTVQSDRVAVLDGNGAKVQSGGTQGMADGTHPGAALVAFGATEVKNKVTPLF